MASEPTLEDLMDYASSRVFDGVRPLDDKRSAEHRDRLKKAIGDALDKDWGGRSFDTIRALEPKEPSE